MLVPVTSQEPDAILWVKNNRIIIAAQRGNVLRPKLLKNLKAILRKTASSTPLILYGIRMAQRHTACFLLRHLADCDHLTQRNHIPL